MTKEEALAEVLNSPASEDAYDAYKMYALSDEAKVPTEFKEVDMFVVGFELSRRIPASLAERDRVLLAAREAADEKFGDNGACKDDFISGALWHAGFSA